MSFEDTCDKSRPWLGFKPGALGRHIQPSICHIQQLIYLNRVHLKSAYTVFIAPFQQSVNPATSPYKINSGIIPNIFNAQNVSEHFLIQNLYV